MKRGATRQIQREDGENPHGIEASEEKGLVASPLSVGERVIRGLPKRKAFAASTSAPSSTPALSFNIGSAAASSFAAAPSSAAPSTLSFGQPASANASSMSMPATTTSSSFSSSTGGSGSVSSDVTSKPTFSTNRGFSFKRPTIAATPSSSLAAASPASDPSYYLSLRGLNHSLKDAMSKALVLDGKDDEREFADLAPVIRSILEKYEKKRIEIIKDDKRPAASPCVSTDNSSQIGSTSGLIFQPVPFSTPVAGSTNSTRGEEKAKEKESQAGHAQIMAPQSAGTSSSTGSPILNFPVGGSSFAGNKVADAAKEFEAVVEPPKNLPKFEAPSGCSKAESTENGKNVDPPMEQDKLSNSDNSAPVQNGKTEQSGATESFAPSASSSTASNAPAPFSFGARLTPAGNALGSSTPFGFGSAMAGSKSTASASTTPQPAATGFSFGGFSRADSSKSSSTPSTGFSFGTPFKPAETDAAGNISFANPSNNVSQPGMFDFGKAGGKISFGGGAKDEEGKSGGGKGQQ